MNFRVREKSNHIDIYYNGGSRASFLPSFEGKDADPESGEPAIPPRPARLYLKAGFNSKLFEELDFELDPDLFREVFERESADEVSLSTEDERVSKLLEIRRQYLQF